MAIEADRESNAKARTAVSGPAGGMGRFGFLSSVTISHHQLRVTSPVMTAVQGEHQTLSGSLELIQTLKERFE